MRGVATILAVAALATIVLGQDKGPKSVSATPAMIACADRLVAHDVTIDPHPDIEGRHGRPPSNYEVALAAHVAFVRIDFNLLTLENRPLPKLYQYIYDGPKPLKEVLAWRVELPVLLKLVGLVRPELVAVGIDTHDLVRKIKGFRRRMDALEKHEREKTEARGASPIQNPKPKI